MNYLTTSEIREKYLKFFEDKGSLRMPSSSLIPDDPSLLLTSAGMVQFKPYFLQQKILSPNYIGTTTVQKCVRTNDIDIIGTTGRHLSFFEMLGNFSFGKYFKKEMCKWSIEFSCDVLGLDFNRLYFTVYKDDDETIDIWKSLGVDASHISKLGEEENFWRAGPTGPCGPCSELYYDQGEEFSCGSKTCAPGCDCDRYLEFWNLVFTQYDGQKDGSFLPLPKKNIDTGMGLERIAAILQGVQSNYETDVLYSLIQLGERLMNIKYKENKKTDHALRVIADHSRSVTFMIADGILPGNEGRDYVLRRLLRRCVMKAYMQGIRSPFLSNYIDQIINLMGSTYPEIKENENLIKRVVLKEETRFLSNLSLGTELLDELLSHVNSGEKISGEDAFKMHDTYGFPIEVTQEICQDRGIEVDVEGFRECMKQQQQRARSANADIIQAAWDNTENLTYKILKEYGLTKFCGYNKTESQSNVLAIIKDNKLVDSISKGDSATLFVESTPFYGEMGGQVGDSGVIYFKDGSAQVSNTTLPESKLYAHHVCVNEGSVQVGQSVILKVDKQKRDLTSRNHTATHILHAALRKVLGDHVKQAGSFVSDKMLRFDFTHFENIEDTKLREVEILANKYVSDCIDLKIFETTLDKAKQMGVTALFGEKYGHFVRVVQIDKFSSELCGGTHVKNTSEIGLIKITKQSSIGSNSRRIEAVTSLGAYNYCNDYIHMINLCAKTLKCSVSDINKKIESNILQIRHLKKDIEAAYNQESLTSLEQYLTSVVESKAGYKLLVYNLGNIENIDMRQIWDKTRENVGDSCACVIGGFKNNKAYLLAAGTSNACKLGFSANQIIKQISPIIEGRGGGSDRLAQAGGSKLDKLSSALDKAKTMLL